MFDNFKFQLISNFPGYVSSIDKTNAKLGILVRGCQNVYKKISGTIANRFGLLRRGVADATIAGVKEAYSWKSSIRGTVSLRVANNKLQFESDISDGSTLLWYDLLETGILVNPAISLTRFSFDSWYEYVESKDRLLMVRGDADILDWSGGVTKVSGGTATGVGGNITGINASAAGTGYGVNELITLSGGSGALIQVTAISGSGNTGPITASLTLSTGVGYSLGTFGTVSLSGSGSGATFTVTSVADTNQGTLTKLDSSTTWIQDGFASIYPQEKKVVINGQEFSYLAGEGTQTLMGVSPDPSGVISGSIAIQSVIVYTTDFISSATAPVALPENDFIKVLDGQLFVGSYTSKKILISARTTSRFLGFLDYVNIGSLVTGDPDFAIIDAPATGMFPKDGKMYVSGASSDWFIITPNVPLPVGIGSANTLYIRTEVEKVPGSGLSSALAHEFIEAIGGDIVFLAQDNQLRTFSTSSRSIFTKKFPSFSQEINNELFDEDFTGGHLKSIGDFLYATAPLSGRHYMYQIRESVDSMGNVVAERIWHPPQVAGISRFVEIDGIVFGHSNQNPQIYQIWDTNQWHDDSPNLGNDGITYDELSYTSVLRLSYAHLQDKNGIDRVATGRFDKVYYEGYMTPGSNIYGNVYFDYQGAEGTQNVIVNTVQKPAIFYQGNQVSGIGQNSLGDNPLGDGLVVEPNDQSLLPKFRTICDINPTDSFEHQLEVYSIDADARWEILAIGSNLSQSPSQAVELRKNS